MRDYYEKIPNYDTITTLPEENLNYIKETLPNVTSCYDMLYNCKALTSIDTTGWDTSNITDMTWMFCNCQSLKTLDISNFNTSKVTNMGSMFSSCYSLTTLDVSKFNTSNVTDMSFMFNNCNSLKTLDVSKFNTSNVIDMDKMFYWDTSLTTITGVIDMKSCTSYSDIFTGCIKLTGVKIKNPPSGITATSGIGGLAAGKYTIV